MSDNPFTGATLREAAFIGWIPFDQLRSSSCPPTGGVYVVTYGSEKPAFYPDRSCGGWFKGKDPTVNTQVLAANWVDGAEVVYIGKADNLKRRLVQFADFGVGKPIGHWGGRLIWQLPHIGDLIVAWKETPGQVPAAVEAGLIASFRLIYGKPPFANSPHLLGR